MATRSAHARAKPKSRAAIRPAMWKSPPRIDLAGLAKVGRSAAQKKWSEAAVAELVPGDAMLLLMQDHREAEAFFDQFEQEEDEEIKATLAEKICLALTVHTEIEEEIFYPAARDVGVEDLLDEAEVEHASAKQLIAEIQAMKPDDDLFDAKVKVLGEYVKHHVQEEETELFPKLREKEFDALAVGKKLLTRKIELLRELAPADR